MNKTSVSGLDPEAVHVTAGEKGDDEKDGRERGLSKRHGDFERDKPPVVTLVRRSDGRVQFLVRDNFQNVDEEIAEYGNGSVILCIDQYDIYDGIETRDGVDGQVAGTPSGHFVVDDAHTNPCENRHSLIRQWLGKFCGVSKYYLQEYLDFPALLLNSSTGWFSSFLSADSSG